MRCPSCGQTDSRVLTSRTADPGVRRRRQCQGCDERFSTVEQVQHAVIMVVKKDGRREEFLREKLLGGIRVCTRKRPLAAGATEAIVDDIEDRLMASGRDEVQSRVIGEMVITHLKQLDPIAYIRFASAYRQFVSIDDMMSELSLLGQSPIPPPQQRRLFEDDFDRAIAGGAPDLDLDADGGDGLPRTPTPIESARSATSATIV